MHAIRLQNHWSLVSVQGNIYKKGMVTLPGRTSSIRVRHADMKTLVKITIRKQTSRNKQILFKISSLEQDKSANKGKCLMYKFRILHAWSITLIKHTVWVTESTLIITVCGVLIGLWKLHFLIIEALLCIANKCLWLYSVHAWSKWLLIYFIFHSL